MTKVSLCVSCKDPAACAARLRGGLAAADLEITLDTTLATLPGSVHWHLRKRGERSGVLEYTMDVRGGRAWLSWHENRYRLWIDEASACLIAVGCGE